VIDCNNIEFYVIGDGGHNYKLKIFIEATTNYEAANIASVDLRYVLPQIFGNYKFRQGHAMFIK